MPRWALVTMVVVAYPVATRADVAAVTGRVEAADSRWDGDAIVTEAVVRGPDGAVTVLQLGGVVDGIGMIYSHQPVVLAPGDDVALDVVRGVTARGTDSLVVVGARVAPRFAASSVPGTAAYGVQRTDRGEVALWRAAGCIEMRFDAASVPEAAARVIDEAFAAWSDAAAACGGLTLVGGGSVALSAVARDRLDIVQIRTERWCRPATDDVPELCYAADASAVTRLAFVDNPADPDDGKVLEADVELNGVGFELLLPGQAPTGARPALDLQSVAAHEAGHVLGLAHNCGTAGALWPTDHDGNAVPACDGQPAGGAVAAATMFYRIAPGESHGRTLEPGDVRGACAMARGADCEPAIAVGGCRASRGDRSWLLVALILVALRLVTGRSPRAGG